MTQFIVGLIIVLVLIPVIAGLFGAVGALINAIGALCAAVLEIPGNLWLKAKPVITGIPSNYATAYTGFAGSPPKLPTRDDVGAALREWLEYPASIGSVHEGEPAQFLDPWHGTLSAEDLAEFSNLPTPIYKLTVHRYIRSLMDSPVHGFGDFSLDWDPPDYPIPAPRLEFPVHDNATEKIRRMFDQPITPWVVEAVLEQPMRPKSRFSLKSLFGKSDLNITQIRYLNAKEELKEAERLAIERNMELEKLLEKAKREYEAKEIALRKEFADSSERHNSQRLEFEQDVQRFKKVRADTLSCVEQAGIVGFNERFKLRLRAKLLPFTASLANFEISLEEESRLLILEIRVPNVSTLSWQRDDHLKRDPSQKSIKESVSAFYPSLALRLAKELYEIDLNKEVDGFVVNGWCEFVDASTGKDRRAFCLSLFATRDQLEGVNLSAADPQKAFDALKGIAGRVSEVVPITPKVQINRNDKRFVESQDVLRNLSSQDNLASMPWEDFEHLCRQVLEKEFASDGAEVKVTQASRDKGVDAIVFDNRSLREGKIVVQAKRYTRTVDVSAVRDLYGTMMNEGAMKGILITTSHFGADSYEFIQGKPLSLVSGAELLGLLQKHGYDFRIDLDEARKLMGERE